MKLGAIWKISSEIGNKVTSYFITSNDHSSSCPIMIGIHNTIYFLDTSNNKNAHSLMGMPRLTIIASNVDLHLYN